MPVKILSWLDRRLHRKYLVGVGAGLLGTSLLFLLLFIAMYQERLREEGARTATEVNRLLQTSLENAMLKQDLDGLRTILDQLGNQPGIESVMIINPRDEVRFSSDPEVLGTHYDREQSSGCIECHGQPAENRPYTLLFSPSDDLELMRSVNPVANREPCQRCHGPVAEYPYNGMLVIDYNAAPLRKSARNTTLLLMGAGAIVLFVTLVGGWWFMRHFVLAPVRRLTRASEAMTAGDTTTRVGLTGEDELAVLGARFDAMAASLQHSIDREKEHRLFLQALVDAIPDGIRVIDPEYRTVISNRAFRTQLGLDADGSSTGELCYQSAHGRDEPCVPTLMTCPLEEIRNGAKNLKCLHHHQRANGSPLEVEIFAAPMLVPRDGVPTTLVVEASRDLEQQVVYSHEQKLADLGQLAAGVAHEVRNPLSSVRLALRALLDQPQQNEQTAQYLKLVDDEVDNCIKVSDRLLALSARPSEQQQLVPVNPAVSDTASLLNFEAERQSVEIHFDLDPNGPRVLATDSELRMGVLNLMQNAFHAMPDGGRLCLATGYEGDDVIIAVVDNGKGIAKQDLKRVFHPFFTRRADGSTGTGLGLSISNNLVARHGGHIDVDSELGSGSRFTIRFPNPDLKLDDPTDADSSNPGRRKP